MSRRLLGALCLGILAFLLQLGVSLMGHSQTGSIKIGEINSYTGLPAFTIPYRQGWQMALAEINEAGGVLGQPLEVISRDDGGKPGDALTAANELVSREKVSILAGTFFSNVGLAVADFAKQKKIVFLAAEPLSDAVTLDQGNRYTFRLRPSTYMQAAMLVEEAAALPAKRWATIAPNYEYGTSAVTSFKQLLSAARPDVEWVGEQFPALNKLEAGPTIQALEQTKPEAIFNVTFGADLAEFVREGRSRGLFENRAVVSLLTGEPEYLDPLGSEAPEGWIVTGYPWYDIETPEHDAFVQSYQERYNDYPRLGSLVGYNTMKAIAAALETAGSPDPEALIPAMEGLSFESPLGSISFRASDHQATMGAFVGTTAVREGQGVMVDWYYADGADYLPSEEEVAKRRPQD